MPEQADNNVDDLDEGMEPGEEEYDSDALPSEELQKRPMRIALFFTGVGDDGESRELDGVIDGVIEDATKRGLFFEWGASDEMKDKEVIKGSPLWQAVHGREF